MVGMKLTYKPCRRLQLPNPSRDSNSRWRAENARFSCSTLRRPILDRPIWETDNSRRTLQRAIYLLTHVENNWNPLWFTVGPRRYEKLPELLKIHLIWSRDFSGYELSKKSKGCQSQWPPRHLCDLKIPTEGWKFIHHDMGLKWAKGAEERFDLARPEKCLCCAP